jgi:hypothetical protein
VTVPLAATILAAPGEEPSGSVRSTTWSGASRQAVSSSISICKVVCPIPKRRLSSLAARIRNSSPGWPPGTTRCAVRAVSVVLIGQMCRSWTAATPTGLRYRRTACGSIGAGTALTDTPAVA